MHCDPSGECALPAVEWGDDTAAPAVAAAVPALANKTEDDEFRDENAVDPRSGDSPERADAEAEAVAEAAW